MNFRFKKAAVSDVPAIIELMTEFAEYEYLLEFIEITVEDLTEVICGKSAFVEGLVVFDNAKTIAYALFFPHFASFRGQKSIYLEDIFITEKYRRSGLGKEMLRRIARIGKQQGAVRMDFQVLNRNTSAVNFYLQNGADINEDERHFNFTGDSFERLTS